MIVDIKVSVWQRIRFTKPVTKKQVLNILKKRSVTDLWELDPDAVCDDLDDTEEVLTPEDNDGHATIEVFKGNEPIELIWKNGL